MSAIVKAKYKLDLTDLRNNRKVYLNDFYDISQYSNVAYMPDQLIAKYIALGYSVDSCTLLSTAKVTLPDDVPFTPGQTSVVCDVEFTIHNQIIY